MPGRRINGNDAIEVFSAAEKAVACARSGGGPSLLECMTYRWYGHVGPNYDVGEKLRSQEELDSWMGRCPIRDIEKILWENDLLSDSERSQIKEEIECEVQDAITFAREADYPDVNELYRYLFSNGAR